MIVVVHMKNITKQGETYYFRMAIPKDCVAAVGKNEISLSLKTKNPLEAEKRAAPLQKKWKAEFKRVRAFGKGSGNQDTEADESEPIKTPNDYLHHYRDLMTQNLPALIDQASEAELQEIAEHYTQSIAYIQQDDELVAPRNLDVNAG